MGYVEMGVKYAMGESSTLYRRRLHAQGYLCGDFKKHLTAASDSGHRGMDEPSLTRPLWAFVSARSLGSSHSPDRHLCGLQGSPNLFFRHKVVSVTTDLIRCNGRPVRHGRVVYFVQTATICPRVFMWGLQEALDCSVRFWTPRVGRAFVDTAALGLRVCTISRVLALLEFGCVLGSLYRAHHLRSACERLVFTAEYEDGHMGLRPD